MSAGITDNRSPLLRALGDRVAVRVVTVEKGRLRGVPLALRALSHAEMQQCRRAASAHMTGALAWAQEQLVTEAGEEDLETEVATQVLALALVEPQSADAVRPGDARRIVADANELRDILTKGEIALLWRIWNAHEEERSPLSTAKGWADVEATLEALGKARVSSYALHGYDTATRLFIITELAERLYSTPTSSPSSDTSPSSESPNDSPDTSDSTTSPTMTVE